jgi:signal peptidase I
MVLKAFRLEGSSMRPLFRAGDTALVVPSRLGRGDCAVYRAGGRALLHRVAGFAGDRVVLRDDGWEMPPHAVHPRHILGRVVSRNPLKSGLPGYAWFLARGLLKWLRKNPSSRN